MYLQVWQFQFRQFRTAQTPAVATHPDLTILSMLYMGYRLPKRHRKRYLLRHDPRPRALTITTFTIMHCHLRSSIIFRSVGLACQLCLSRLVHRLVYVYIHIQLLRSTKCFTNIYLIVTGIFTQKIRFFVS